MRSFFIIIDYLLSIIIILPYKRDGFSAISEREEGDDE